MTVTPTSSAALALAGARKLVAASPAFATHVAAVHGDTTADADKHIYYHDVWNKGAKIRDLRPFAVITLASNSYDTLAQCSATALKVAGGVLVAFFDNPRQENSDDVYIEFLNWMYGTLDDQQDRFGIDDNYPFNAIADAVNPDRVDVNRRATDDFMFGAAIFEHDREVG